MSLCTGYVFSGRSPRCRCSQDFGLHLTKWYTEKSETPAVPYLYDLDLCTRLLLQPLLEALRPCACGEQRLLRRLELLLQRELLRWQRQQRGRRGARRRVVGGGLLQPSREPDAPVDLATSSVTS